MSDVAHYKRFDWLIVPARDVVVGDLIANQATVTEVVRGPRNGQARDFDNVKRDHVLVRCGDSWACKGQSSRAFIVGRNFREAFGSWVPNGSWRSPA